MRMIGGTARLRPQLRTAACIAPLFLFGACVGPISTDPRFAIGVGNTDVIVPVASFEARRFATIIRQQYDFSCGSAALATLLHYHYADRQTEAAVFEGMWRDGDREQIRRVGFSLLDMKRYLAARGLRSDGYKVTLGQIEKRGVPGIALITVRGYRHFVVLKGVNTDAVLVGDPSLGLRTMSRAEFQTAWNGVYFVLNSNIEQGQRRFDTDLQWARFSRAPLGGRFLEPLSLQALALTAPFFGDF